MNSVPLSSSICREAFYFIPSYRAIQLYSFSLILRRFFCGLVLGQTPRAASLEVLGGIFGYFLRLVGLAVFIFIAV